MVLKQFQLDGKTALVTGANTGIGQGIACGFAEAGADIVAIGRSDMTETSSIVTDLGRKCLVIKADLADYRVIQAIVDKSLATFGQIDILCNNAGIIRRADAVDYSLEDFAAVMDVNLKSVFLLSQAVAKYLIASGRPGKILNIASLLSFQGGIRVPAYTASKCAVRGLTMAFANEWAKLGINVNAIAPGYIETNNTINLRNDQKRYAEILARIPAGRWGRPDDIVGAAVFLCSDAANYLHGITLPVDGGWLAR